jgi:hypothetical protein
MEEYFMGKMGEKVDRDKMRARQLTQIEIKEIEDFYVNNSLRVQNKFRPVAYIIK